MLQKAIGFLARIAVGKQLVAGIAKVHNTLSGRRSEIALGILALTYALKVVGVMPAETADGIEKAIAAILPLTLAEKFAKAKALVDQVVPAAPENGPAIPPA